MKHLLENFAFWLLDKTKGNRHVKSKQQNDDLQILKEQECVAKGHIWKTYGIKDASNDDLTTSERCFCARCGQKYHKHIYKQNN